MIIHKKINLILYFNIITILLTSIYVIINNHYIEGNKLSTYTCQIWLTAILDLSTITMASTIMFTNRLKIVTHGLIFSLIMYIFSIYLIKTFIDINNHWFIRYSVAYIDTMLIIVAIYIGNLWIRMTENSKQW